MAKTALGALQTTPLIHTCWCDCRSRVPPLVKVIQAAGGTDESPLEAFAAPAAAAETAQHSWSQSPSSSSGAAIVQQVSARAAAAAELVGMFWQHAAKPLCGSWLPAALSEPAVAEQLAAVQQQPWQLHPALVAAAGVAGVQRQLSSVLGYLAQPHHQPEVYCMDGELLSRCC